MLEHLTHIFLGGLRKKPYKFEVPYVSSISFLVVAINMNLFYI